MRRVAKQTGTDEAAFLTSFACKSCGLEKSARVHVAERPHGRRNEPTAPDRRTLDVPPEVAEVLSRLQCPRCEHVERPFRPLHAARFVMLGLAIALGSCVEAVTQNSVLWMGGCVVG